MHSCGETRGSEHRSADTDSVALRPDMVGSPSCRAGESDPDQLSVHKLRIDDPEFRIVTDIRIGRGGPGIDPFDETADHYIALVGGQPLAIARINQARRGRLDCEEHYPPVFLAEFRDCIASASRFCRRNGTKARPDLMRRFLLAIRKDQYADGIRVDVINVHIPMIPYYQTLRYELVPRSGFRHPRLDTDSVVMALVADAHAMAFEQGAHSGPAEVPLLASLRHRLFGECADTEERDR